MLVSHFKDKMKDDKFRGLVGLYIGRITLSISSALLGLFLPIFFYKIFNQNFQYVILYYLLSSIAYALLIPVGAQFLNKFGFKKALVLSSTWASFFYAVLFFMKEGSSMLLFLVPLSFLMLLFFRMFYWIPYRIDFAKSTNKNNRGSQISLLFATFTILGVVGPIISGYVINNFGFSVLFAIVFVILLFAGIPFSIIPKTNERFVWGYKETWKNVFSKKNRLITLSFVASGAENIIGLIVWPIFIFLLLNGDYLKVGAVSSFIIGGTVILQIIAGKYLDKTSEKKKMLKLGTVLYAIGWVFKIFVFTAYSIFVVGLYHSVTKILTRTSFLAMFYEIAEDKGHYIDEFTVLREISTQIGRVLSLSLVIIISFFMPIQWTFVIAAIATILFNALYIKKEI